MGDPAPSRIFAAGLLAGQVCVVSGAGTGIGRETALELARLGATVVGCGRRPEPLAQTSEAIRAEGGVAEEASLDIRDEDAVGRFLDGVLDRHGRLDVRVNNAGGQCLSPAEAITPKGFRTVVDLNVQGTWQMTHAAATKAFTVENMTRTLSVEWARFGIRLAAIAAGQFDTEVLRTKYPREVTENVSRTIPVGRLGRPEELAWMVAYLASPAGDFISGAVITIDGARDNWFGPWPPPAITGAAGEPVAEERRPRSDKQ